MTKETPTLTPRQQQLRTLRLFLLVFVGPLLLLRVAFVSPREVCLGAGGDYAVVGRARVCAMPEGRACPKPYRWLERGGGCTNVSSIPVILRFDTW